MNMTKHLGRYLALVALCRALTTAEPVAAGQVEGGAAESKASASVDRHREADEFFAGPISRLKLELTPENYGRLAGDERNYVPATLTEVWRNGKPVSAHSVEVKLKGHGSFQHLGAKPSLTVNFKKPKDGSRFHGMRKIHLNNSSQDPTYLSEFIAGEMGRKAGVPAARATHATLEINGRDVGIYVAKEAIDADCLAAFYKDTSGDIYTNEYINDLTEGMEKKGGDPTDKTAIKALIAACREPDDTKRWEQLDKVLDIEQFMTFSAMEVIMCHWDGYNSFNHNNYHLYNDPSTGKFSFILHGMDTCFGDENYTLAHNFLLPRGSMVGDALMRHPQGPPMYWARLKSLYDHVLTKEDWGARVAFAGNRLRDAIAVKNPQQAEAYAGTVRQAVARVTRRVANVGRQLELPVKPFFVEAAGVPVPKAWVLENSGGGTGDRVKFDGRNCLHLVATGAGVPSWRQKVTLQAGRYRMGTIMGVRGVESVEDEHGRGAGICISGAGKRVNVLEGDGGFNPGEGGGNSVSYEFETAGGEVELVFELRASQGEAWLAIDNFGMVRGR